MAKYALVKGGSVENVIVWDGIPYTPATESQPAHGWSPPDGYVTVNLDDSSPVGPGWAYDGSTFSAPPVETPALSPADVVANNTAVRDGLLQQAATALAPLQMAVALGEATDEETSQAKMWVAFSRAVKAVDLSQASPMWPEPPSA